MDALEVVQLIQKVEVNISELSRALDIHKVQDERIAELTSQNAKEMEDLKDETQLKFEEISRSMTELKTLVIQTTDNNSKMLWEFTNRIIKVLCFVIVLLGAMAGAKALPEILANFL